MKRNILLKLSKKSMIVRRAKSTVKMEEEMESDRGSEEESGFCLGDQLDKA